MQGRSSQEVLSQGGEVAAYLKENSDHSYFRVYSPSYSLPQQTAAADQLQLADGVDPLQLASYWSFMLTAIRCPILRIQCHDPRFRQRQAGTG